MLQALNFIFFSTFINLNLYSSLSTGVLSSCMSHCICPLYKPHVLVYTFLFFTHSSGASDTFPQPSYFLYSLLSLTLKTEKTSSSQLVHQPAKLHGFSLHKRDFYCAVLCLAHYFISRIYLKLLTYVYLFSTVIASKIWHKLLLFTQYFSSPFLHFLNKYSC